MNCRFCSTQLAHEFIDLVNAPPSNSFLQKHELNIPEAYYPLKVMVCHRCFLVQVDEHKNSEAIFNNEYVYFSSFSSTWLQHARDYSEMIIDRLGLTENSQVVEIASNDGYLLKNFVRRGIPALGIEPTANTARVAEANGIQTIVEFFGSELARSLVRRGFEADLFIGNNVLAHVPDIVDVVKGIKIILKPLGVVTMEFPHLLELMRHNQFDTIYHEHFSYLSLHAVRNVFASEGLTVFDVQALTTHGGSLRIFARHREADGIDVLPSVRNLLEVEAAEGLTNIETYSGFRENVLRAKFDFTKALIELKLEGKQIAGYGAAAKGNTLLNYCGIKNDLIEFVVDANPAKQNKFLPGSHIKVVSEEMLRASKPDFVVIFPWNLKDEIISQLSYIREWGGRFIIPIPKFEIV